MFIIKCASTCWASANVRAFRASASSWLCSAITPAPQQDARSSSTSSMSSSGATFAIEPCSSGVKPRLTQPGQYATFTTEPPSALVRDASRSCVGAPLGRRRGGVAAVRAAHVFVPGAGPGSFGRRIVVGLHDVQVELEALVLVLDRVE